MEEETKAVDPVEKLATPYEFITGDDVTNILLMIIISAAIVLIISWVLNFLPSFMTNMLKKIKNPSLIYSTDYLKESNITDFNIDEPTIDLSDLGTKKSTLFHWFTKKDKG